MKLIFSNASNFINENYVRHTGKVDKTTLKEGTKKTQTFYDHKVAIVKKFVDLKNMTGAGIVACFRNSIKFIMWKSDTMETLSEEWAEGWKSKYGGGTVWLANDKGVKKQWKFDDDNMNAPSVDHRMCVSQGICPPDGEWWMLFLSNTSQSAHRNT